jgi:hypothetical protein
VLDELDETGGHGGILTGGNVEVRMQNAEGEEMMKDER